jgi:hypothetical protein
LSHSASSKQRAGVRTVMARMFGMNVSGVPLASHPHWFGVVIGMVAVCSPDWPGCWPCAGARGGSGTDA